MARPVGSKNTKANEIKNMVLHSLDRVGGIEYLAKQAIDNPAAYLSLIGKVLPRDFNHGGQPDNPIVTENVHERIRELATRIGIAGITGTGVRESAESEVPTVH